MSGLLSSKSDAGPAGGPDRIRSIIILTLLVLFLFAVIVTLL